MIFNSMRWRLQAWHGALLTAIVVGFGVTAHRLASVDRLRLVDEELQTRSVQLATAVPPSRAPQSEASQPDSAHYFIVWLPDGHVQSWSANAPNDLAKPTQTSDLQHTARTRGTMREFIRFTQQGRCFLVGRSIENELAQLQRLAWYLAAAGGAVLALGLLGGAWLTARALRSIADISATAEKIATGELSQRIDTAGFADELQRLAGVLNSTFSRLDAAFAQQARFTADAAHELRTPVSVMLMHSENGLASQHLTGEQREAFEASRRASQRMRRLIEHLLDLARLDAGRERMKREPFDLVQTARDCIELVRPLADARGIRLHSGFSQVSCAGDGERIAQVITNLLTNAIKYNREGGEVRVAIEQKNGAVILAVTDTGIGISAEDLPHVFERFYRVDKSRSDGARRSGLGLAISKAIVEAHGGTLEVSSRTAAGATFTMRLQIDSVTS